MNNMVCPLNTKVSSYPNKYGQAISMHNPRETNLAPALQIGGRDVMSFSRIFISSSVNL